MIVITLSASLLWPADAEAPATLTTTAKLVT